MLNNLSCTYCLKLLPSPIKLQINEKHSDSNESLKIVALVIYDWINMGCSLQADP